jgi:hypothetical protein
MGEPTVTSRAPEGLVLWESVKFDGSPHRSAQALDLGTTQEGRWLFVMAGTPVTRPVHGDYNHPCDAVVLIPSKGLWIATWLVGWDPMLHVDIARRVHVGSDRVVTIDLDVDVVRKRNGDVYVVDRDEFESHRKHFGYSNDLVSAVTGAVKDVANAISRQEAPFHMRPNAPMLPRTPDA